MENTVVGVYDSYAQAQNVMNELIACGFSRDEIQLSPEASERTSAATDTTGSQHSGSGIGHFFRSLFGMEDDEYRQHHDIYAEATRRGSCVVTVDADSEEDRERAIEVMNRFDPVDIDERATHWRSQGWTGYDEAAPIFSDSEIEKDRALYGQNRTTESPAESMRGEQQRIPIVEEELQVGKRAVQRGGVRIYQRMTETPVQESVNLREEHVNIERHPADQPASEADMAALKEATERTENVNDAVRRTEVDVEQLGAADRSTTGATTAADTSMASGTGMREDFADTAMTSDDSDYRTHWQNAYGATGGRYEDYDAAYRYGSMAGGSERYRNYRWEDAESNLRSDWERDHPESAWDKVKDAVRYGAERVTGRQRGQ